MVGHRTLQKGFHIGSFQIKHQKVSIDGVSVNQARMINIDHLNVEKLNESPHFIVITLKHRIE